MKYQIIGTSVGTEKFATLSIVADSEIEARGIATGARIKIESLIPLANPLLEQQANWFCEIYSEFLERKSLWLERYLQQGVGDGPSMSDIETTYFTKRHEIAVTVEQIQLAVPEISRQFPFAEFATRRDQRVRDTHRAMNGLIALRTWAGWAKIRPPCGWRCRCYIINYTRRDAMRAGLMTPDGKPTFEVRWPSEQSRLNYECGMFPDKGFHGPKYVAP